MPTMGELQLKHKNILDFVVYLLAIGAIVFTVIMIIVAVLR